MNYREGLKLYLISYYLLAIITETQKINTTVSHYM